jgi:hypothetical protein
MITKQADTSVVMQDRLLEALVNQYKAKGKNLQGILDNQLFQQLPLDKKVAFIEQAGGPISSAPTSSYSTAGKGAIGGAIAGIMGGAMHRFGNSSVSPYTAVGAMIAGAALGALGGGLAGTIRSIIDNERNKKISTLAGNRDGLGALIHSSISSSGGSSPLLRTNKFLDQIEGSIDSKLPSFAEYIAQKSLR